MSAELAATPAAPAAAPSAPSTSASKPSTGSTTTPASKSTTGSASSTSSVPKQAITKDNIHAYLNSPERQAKLDALNAELDSAEVDGGDAGESGELLETSGLETSAGEAEGVDGEIEQDPVTAGVEGDAEQPDFSWAQELAEFKDGLHGIALKELLAALRDGRLPEAFYDKIQLELADGDTRWTSSINDARNGAMMRRKFDQKSQAFAEERKAWDAEKSDFVDYWRSAKEDATGARLMDVLERLGMPLDAMSRAYSERLGKLNSIWQLEQQGHVAEGTTQQLWNAQQEARELRDLKYQQQLQQQREQAAKDEQQSEQITQLVTQAGAQAMKNVGLDPHDNTEWGIFRRYVNDAMQQTGKVPTREEIVNCAIAAKEEIQSLLSAAEKRKQPAAGQQAQQRAVPRNADPAPAQVSKETRRGAVKPISTKDWLKKHRFGIR